VPFVVGEAAVTIVIEIREGAARPGEVPLPAVRVVIRGFPIGVALRADSDFFTREAAVVVPIVHLERTRRAIPFLARDHAVVVAIHFRETDAVDRAALRLNRGDDGRRHLAYADERH
jgi:hypothetical protein